MNSNSIKDSLSLSSSSTAINSPHDSTNIEMKNMGIVYDRKKVIIKQSDICDELFRLFIFNDYNLNIAYVIELLLLFISSVQKEKIQVHTLLISVLISLIRKIENKNQLITMIIQYQSIPDTFELANFLLNEFAENEKIHSLGLDMMKRMHKFDVIVIELIKKGRLAEALLFCKKYKVSIEVIPDDVKEILKQKMRLTKNKKLIIDFISY